LRFRDPSLHLFDTDQGYDGQTDVSTMAKTSKALHAVARKNRNSSNFLCVGRKNSKFSSTNKKLEASMLSCSPTLSRHCAFHYDTLPYY